MDHPAKPLKANINLRVKAGGSPPNRFTLPSSAVKAGGLQSAVGAGIPIKKSVGLVLPKVVAQGRVSIIFYSSSSSSHSVIQDFKNAKAYNVVCSRISIRFPLK